MYSSISENNGVMGYTNLAPTYKADEKIPFYVVFGDHTRSFNIANADFCVMDNVKILRPLHNNTLNELLFVISAWKNGIVDKGYARHWNIAKEVKIQLPTKNGKIDFQFMESFVAELEAYRVAELEAYLTITGLKDYELTDEEKEALEIFSEIQWKEYRVGDLFDRIKANKLTYKAKDLPKEPLKEYILPALTSSFMNQGLNYYVPKSGATILKNVISLPSNSDVYRAYYQSSDFTVLSDSYAIECKDSVARFTPNDYLFSVACINKVTNLPIYSYKNKLGGWNVVKNKSIQLPVDSSNEIDFEYMKAFTQAIKKLVIKDVVLYVDEKIYATKQVANTKQKYERINEDELLNVAEDSTEYY